MGQELLEQLVRSSGLPEDYARQRLLYLIQASGKSIDDITLNDIREMLADLLLDLIHETTKDERAG
jgi:hypothetical protein